MNSEPPLPKSVVAISVGFLAVLASYLLAAILGGTAGMLVVNALFFGWIGFLDRGLASVFRADWPSLLLGLTAAVVFTAAVHRVGPRLIAASGGRWTWRTTTAVTGGLWLLFAAGIALVGGTHQLLWLVAGKTPSSLTPQSAWRKDSGTGVLSLVTNARRAAWQSESRNNLKHFLLAMHNYHASLRQLPPGAILLPDGRGYRGWVSPLGPNIGFNDPWAWEGKDQTWDGVDVAKYGKGAMPVFVHPELGWHGQFDDRGFALMHYAGNVHIFPNNRGMKLSEITDGESNTLAVGEVAENFQPWASPWNRRDPTDGINDVPWGFGGPPWQHGAQFALVDGSVRMISRNIDRKVLKALGTPAGQDGADIPGDW